MRSSAGSRKSSSPARTTGASSCATRTGGPFVFSPAQVEWLEDLEERFL